MGSPENPYSFGNATKRARLWAPLTGEIASIEPAATPRAAVPIIVSCRANLLARTGRRNDLHKEKLQMATLDIRGTVVGETALAIKAPCLVATTGSNIALTGVQAIDGVTVGNNSERVLVKDQTTQSQNGIYIASTGPWVLAADFTSNNNITLGTLVLVVEGASNSGTLFEQTCTDNPIVIGTSLIAFVPLANATAQAATSVTSVAVGTGAQT